MKKRKSPRFRIQIWKGKIEMQDQPCWFQLVVLILEMIFLGWILTRV